MEDHTLKLIICATVCWGITFIVLRKILPNRSFDFCNRLVSTIHATLAVCLASYSVQDWKCPVYPLASPSSPLQIKTMAITAGYLIYDLVCCFCDKGVNLDNVFHHIVSIIGLGSALVYQKSGSELVAALWVSEMSSPLLHMRELLKELGYRDTDLSLAVDILFALTFSFARMIAGPYITYVTLVADNPMIIKMMAMGLQLVSAFWFYKILRMVSYKLTKRTSSKSQ